MKARQFVDTVAVHARGGAGGDGSCSFRREKFVPRGGPDGGDGGHGGSVIFRGDENVDSLVALFFRSQLFAEKGVSGAGRKRHGRAGRNLVMHVPLGTVVRDAETDEELGDIVSDGQELVVAKGGRGGLGNVHWKRADYQAPREFTPGAEGEERRLRLDLRMMADAGLVGFPNAGKSSLLRALTRARPKVDAYPFTTLNPMMGTLVYPKHFASLRIADIPGLIEDAHLGAGLGHNFLRHVERSRVLVFVIDMAGQDGRAPWEDYRALRHELKMRDPELLERERLVIANKMDLPEATENLAEFRKETGESPLEVSATEGLGVETLAEALYEIIKPEPRERKRPQEDLQIKTLGASRRDGTKRKAARRSAHKSAAERAAAARAAEAEAREAASDSGTETAGIPAPRKGYTPPRPLEGRGEHPDAEDVVDVSKLDSATFLDL